MSTKKNPTPAELKKLKPGEWRWIDRGIFAHMTKKKGLMYGVSYTNAGYSKRQIVGPSLTEARAQLKVVRQSSYFY